MSVLFCHIHHSDNNLILLFVSCPFEVFLLMPWSLQLAAGLSRCLLRSRCQFSAGSWFAAVPLVEVPYPANPWFVFGLAGTTFIYYPTTKNNLYVQVGRGYELRCNQTDCREISWYSKSVKIDSSAGSGFDVVSHRENHPAGGCTYMSTLTRTQADPDDSPIECRPATGIQYIMNIHVFESECTSNPRSSPRHCPICMKASCDRAKLWLETHNNQLSLSLLSWCFIGHAYIHSNSK